MAEKSFLALCLCIMCILSVVVSQTQQSGKPVKKAATTKQQQNLPDPANRDTASGKNNKGNPPTSEAEEPNEPVVEHQGSDSATYADQSKDSSGPSYSNVYDSSYRTQYQPYQPSTYKPYAPAYIPANSDTVPVFHNRSTVITGVITTTKDGKVYRISVDKNRTTGLMIDGKKVPDNKLADYYPVLRIIYDEMAAEAERSYNDRIRESEENKRKLEQQNNELKRQLAEEDRKVDNLKVKEAPLQTDGKLQLRQPISPLKPTNLNLNHPKVEFKKSPIKPERSPAEDIVDDMVAAGIVKETNPLSFKLNKGEFMVNGVLQPEAVQRQFQDKYIKHSTDRYEYEKSGSRTSTSITREK